MQLSDLESVFSALNHIVIKLIPKGQSGQLGTGELRDRAEVEPVDYPICKVEYEQ